MKKALLLVLALAGCASLPPGKLEALRARPPSPFDPTGTWMATGTYRGMAVQNQRVIVRRHNKDVFKITREHLRPDGIFERTDGTGFLDGDKLYVGYGPPGFNFALELFDAPPGGSTLDGFYASRGLASGVLQATPDSSRAVSENRLVDRYKLIGGNEKHHFKMNMKLVGGPGAFWMTWEGEGSKEVGVGMIADRALATIKLEILHVHVNAWTGGWSTRTAQGFFGVAVYRMNNGVIEGQSLWGHSDMAGGESPPPPLPGQEQWTRGG
jgi:hypothetical protein